MHMRVPSVFVLSHFKDCQKVGGSDGRDGGAEITPIEPESVCSREGNMLLLVGPTGFY